jgi:hypothetical protein
LPLLNDYGWIASYDGPTRNRAYKHCTGGHHTFVTYIHHDYSANTYPTIITNFFN